ncbi:unnamed protein product [Phaeothamnion confervicola]
MSGLVLETAESAGAALNGAAGYTPKNILVTGGAGFIASHVVLLLVKKYPQYKIVNLDKLDYCACVANLSEIKGYPNYKFIKGNICSSDLVAYLLVEEEIDTILHFAAQTHVDNSFGNSFQFTHNNIYGTHVLLESAKQAGTIRRFVHVSTDEVYGEGDSDCDPMLENNVLEPTNPYAATKAGAEFIAKSYLRSFNLPVIITRGNNVYGPHQYPEKVVPKFINQLMRGRPLTVHGSGNNTRNFLFVEDVARAFDVIMHQGQVAHVYNIGGTNEYSVLQVARDLLKIFGYEGREEEMLTYVEDRAFNDLRYTINSDKLSALGWHEQMGWRDGLLATVAWYRRYSHRFTNVELALTAHPKAGLEQDAAVYDSATPRANGDAAVHEGGGGGDGVGF